MKILDLDNHKKRNGVVINALLGNSEFKQLLGHLDCLCVFSTKTISEPASFTKIGAKHRHAKYLLFPVKLRRQFSLDEYDFDKLTCGCVEYKDKVFVVYGVSKKFGALQVEKT
ncbi:MAG: hypothetical protein ACE5H1_04160 [Thermodesulfobacteriota bacterium]